MMQCIVCNASSSSLSDAVLLVVVVGDVTKQNNIKINSFIRCQWKYRLVSHCSFLLLLPWLLCIRWTLYTLSVASVRWMDGVLVVVVDWWVGWVDRLCWNKTKRKERKRYNYVFEVRKDRFAVFRFLLENSNSVPANIFHAPGTTRFLHLMHRTGRQVNDQI